MYPGSMVLSQTDYEIIRAVNPMQLSKRYFALFPKHVGSTTTVIEIVNTIVNKYFYNQVPITCKRTAKEYSLNYKMYLVQQNSSIIFSPFFNGVGNSDFFSGI